MRSTAFDKEIAVRIARSQRTDCNFQTERSNQARKSGRHLPGLLLLNIGCSCCNPKPRSYFHRDNSQEYRPSKQFHCTPGTPLCSWYIFHLPHVIYTRACTCCRCWRLSTINSLVGTDWSCMSCLWGLSNILPCKIRSRCYRGKFHNWAGISLMSKLSRLLY